jgi:hypothetical protein
MKQIVDVMKAFSRIDLNFTKESMELIGLRTRGMGRGAALSKVDPKGVIHHEKNRVEIRHVGLTEWYINSAKGLEHGFTIPERPKGKGDLRLELSVTQGKARLDDDTVVFTTSTGRQLQYGGIKAYDTAGKYSWHISRFHPQIVSSSQWTIVGRIILLWLTRF